LDLDCLHAAALPNLVEHRISKHNAAGKGREIRDQSLLPNH
jgi:hypothetical protein